jgi:hypothetical protein
LSIELDLITTGVLLEATIAPIIPKNIKKRIRAEMNILTKVASTILKKFFILKDLNFLESTFY